MRLENHVEIAKFMPERLSPRGFLVCGSHLLSREKGCEQVKMTRLGRVSTIKRDELVSVVYAMELNANTSVATPRRADRHGIVDQKPTHFQPLSRSGQGQYQVSCPANGTPQASPEAWIQPGITASPRMVMPINNVRISTVLHIRDRQISRLGGICAPMSDAGAAKVRAARVSIFTIVGYTSV